MSIRNNNNLSERIKSINTSDTLSQFMEKCNDNFSAIIKYGGGPNGERGGKGEQGVPTKPKVPIHVWTKGVEYNDEIKISEDLYEIKDWNEIDLLDSKYQNGHLILLENAHVYVLETDENFNLKPNFVFTLQSFDPEIEIDGRTPRIHIAYADSPDGVGFIKHAQIGNTTTESNTTFDLNNNTLDIINKPYIGICITYNDVPPEYANSYKWIRIQSSAYNVILSDPFITLNVSDISENTNKNFSTYVYVYNNGIDISEDSNLLISLPNDESIKKHFSLERVVNENGAYIYKITFEPNKDNIKFDFQSNNNYKLPIKISYNFNNNENTIDNFTTIVNWNLTQLDFYNVELFVDKKIVNISDNTKQTFKVGYYLTYPNGIKKFIDSNDDKNTNNYKIILTNDINNLNIGYIENWNEATFDFEQSKICYVVLTDYNRKNILDYTTIITTSSEVHLELTQDHIILPCSLEGNSVHPDYKVSDGVKDYSRIQSQMKLYNGANIINNGVTYSLKIDNYNTIGNDNITIYGDGSFYINTSEIKGNATIQCIATYNNVDYIKNLYIELIKTPYEFVLNNDVLSRENGVIINNYLDVSIRYWLNNKWNNAIIDKSCVIAAHTLKSNVTPEYPDNTLPIDEYNTFIFDKSNDTNRRLIIDDNNFKKDKTSKEIRISYYKDDIIENPDNLQPKDELLYKIIQIKDDTIKNKHTSATPNDELLNCCDNKSETITKYNSWYMMNSEGILNLNFDDDIQNIEFKIQTINMSEQEQLKPKLKINSTNIYINGIKKNIENQENTEITYSEIELNNNTLYTLFVDKQNNVYLYN